MGLVVVARDVGEATVVTMQDSGFRVVSKTDSALMNWGCRSTWKPTRHDKNKQILAKRNWCLLRTTRLTGTCCTWGAMAWVGGLAEAANRGEAVVSPWSWVWMVIGWTAGGEDDRAGAGVFALIGLAAGKHMKSSNPPQIQLLQSCETLTPASISLLFL